MTWVLCTFGKYVVETFSLHENSNNHRKEKLECFIGHFSFVLTYFIFFKKEMP